MGHPSTDQQLPTTNHQPTATVGDFTESELIARVSARLPATPDWMVVGIGDDAAVVEPERNRLEVLSVDALVEGVHFDRRFTPPGAIGHRALAVNLSDLAAMGATPRLALLSLALPPDLPVTEFDQMVGELTALAAKYGVVIAGGNMTRIAGPLVLDVTVVGTVKRRRALTRGGARPGDALYVTGSIGAAAAGLQMLQAAHTTQTATLSHDDSPPRPAESLAPAAASCVKRYLYPEPRIRMGSLLGRNRAATACMDLSDGLADAVRQIAGASGVGATIDADALPIDPDARDWFERYGLDAIAESITGGDDYELLIASTPRSRGRLAAAVRHGDALLTRIGSCTADSAIILRQSGSDRPLPRGYSHFR